MADGAPTGSVEVDVASDGMTATMRFQPAPDEAIVDETICLGAAETASIPITSDLKQRVRDFLAALRLQAGASFEAVVATGSPPEHGQDGRLEFAPGFDPREKTSGVGARDHKHDDPEHEHKEQPADDEDSPVDHYSRSGFLMVHEGDRIGKLVAATAGEPGETVDGKSIAPKSGKPLALKMDESIAQEEDGALIAQVDGVLHFDGSRLRVLTELVIDEYVDFSTGHVDFPGDVRVRKGVRDCFHVHADGDLRVEGLVEAAEISSDHTMHLTGGVSGRHKARVVCARDLHARYLDAADVRVGRDLIVDKEVNDCKVDVGGAIASPACAIVGGEVYACRGVEVAIIGQDDARTEVSVGQSRDLLEVQRAADATLGRVQDDLTPAQREYDALMKNMAKLTPMQAERLTELQYQISVRRDQAAKINQALERLGEVAEQYVKPALVVHKRLYSGTRLRVGRFVAKIRADLKGPIRIESPGGKPPIITDLTSNSSRELSDVAQVWKGDEEVGDKPAHAVAPSPAA